MKEGYVTARRTRSTFAQEVTAFLGDIVHLEIGSTVQRDGCVYWNRLTCAEMIISSSKLEFPLQSLHNAVCVRLKVLTPRTRAD